jgi:hydrogenase maturation protease
VVKLVVFGYGNPSRGDDALGPEILARLETERAARADWADIELVPDFQLQIEHALDLEGRGLALFIDASVSSEPPFAFERLEPRRDTSYTSHALTPPAVLHVYAQTTGRAPPPAYVLSVRGYRFGLGQPLSEEARRNLESASAFAVALCSGREPSEWERRLIPRPASGPASRPRP